MRPNIRIQRSSYSRRVKGFTLIEIIVAMSILSIIGSGLMSFFWTGLQVFKRQRAFHETYQNTRFALEEIRRDLVNLVPDSKFPLRGVDGEMVFLTRFNHYEPDQKISSIEKVRYKLEAQSEGQFDLIRESWPLYGLFGPVDPTLKKDVLVQNVQVFLISYADENSDSIDWLNKWEDIDIPPRRVRVVLTPSSKDIAVESLSIHVPIYKELHSES